MMDSTWSVLAIAGLLGISLTLLPILVFRRRHIVRRQSSLSIGAPHSESQGWRAAYRTHLANSLSSNPDWIEPVSVHSATTERLRLRVAGGTRSSVKTLTLGEALHHHLRLLLVAPPGTGKSTLLRSLALTASDSSIE